MRKNLISVIFMSFAFLTIGQPAMATTSSVEMGMKVSNELRDLYEHKIEGLNADHLKQIPESLHTLLVFFIAQKGDVHGVCMAEPVLCSELLRALEKIDF